MMTPELFTPARYRQEAKRIRLAATAMHDGWVRRQMFLIADQYDGLAVFVETRSFPQTMLRPPAL